MSEVKGWRSKNWKLNVYMCQKCRNIMTTVDIDEGTTPFIIICPKCKGDAQSSFYPKERPIPEFVKPPTFEFFKPKSDKEIMHYSKLELKMYKVKNISVDDLYKGNKEHCRLGGLMMRKRTKATPVNHSRKPMFTQTDKHGQAQKNIQ